MAYLYIALFCLVLILLWRRKGPKLNFPGPSGLPVVGCYFSMRGKQMHEVLYDWSMQYGGAFKFSVFGNENLVISHPDTLQEALVTRGKAYAGRPKLYPLQVYSKNYQNLGLTSNIGRHGLLKKAVHGSIKAYGAGRTKLAAILDTATAELVHDFETTSSEPVDPKEMVYRATSMSIYMMLSGQRPGDEISDLPQLVDEFDDASASALSFSVGNVMLDVIPFLRGLSWFPACRYLSRVVESMEQLFERVIKPVLEKSKDSTEHTVGKCLLDIVGQKYGEGGDAGEINLDNVMLTCADLIGAGTGTTTATFCSLLNILQWHPDVQERMHQEVMQEVGDGRAVLLEDRDNMPYSRAVVLEALRYITAAPLAVPHVTTEDTVLSGITVPRGTQVITNLWACHHDPILWPDPWSFKPERFLDEDGQLLLPDHAYRKQLFPFGAGQRGCVGEVLATSRLFLFTTNCVQRFRFLPPDGADPSSCDVRKHKCGLIIEPIAFQTKACLRE